MPAPAPSASAKPAQPVPVLVVPKHAASRVKLMDRLAGYVIRSGGVLVILAVAAIFVFVGKEALPLFLPSQAGLTSESAGPLSTLASPPLVMGLDEYENIVYGLSPTGAVHSWSLNQWESLKIFPLKKLKNRAVTSVYRSPARDQLYVGTADGQLLLAQVKFRPVYTDQGRTVQMSLGDETLVEISSAGSPVRRVVGRIDHNGTVRFAALTEDGTLVAGTFAEGEDPRLEPVLGLPSGEVMALAMDSQSKNLFAAMADGKLAHWYLEDSLEKPFAMIEAGTPQRPITSMDMLIGDVSLILGYRDGSLEQWFGVRDAEEGLFRPFRRIRSFTGLPAAVAHIVPSGRDKGFLAAAEDGTIRQVFTTSGRSVLDLDMGTAPVALALAPKLTGVVAVDKNGRARHWEVRTRHPEISLQTLFGKVWYEGYDRPDYVWQSTGGTDDFEPKFSLTPLILGTLKGAFYGLLFAIPVAVLAAIYTSQFMPTRFRSVVKPAVEIMAALPSVVVGFLAGLWLAPLLELHVVTVTAMVFIIPILVLLAVIAWNQLPIRTRARFPLGTEFGVIALVVLAGFILSANLGPAVEDWLFHGDLRQWVYDTTGRQFEQRNSIVIGFALGFAVIPIIFTMSDDALCNVPEHFVSGSLALGASRWQTAVRIILPTASPGIFSAVMVGFGRAVGETMIVLMATGNTPILDFNPFNGMRTLSANIAVEIPEAPVGGTLYRILFLTAILLFVMTFAVNTVAEIIRQRLRDKYKSV